MLRSDHQFLCTFHFIRFLLALVCLVAACAHLEREPFLFTDVFHSLRSTADGLLSHLLFCVCLCFFFFLNFASHCSFYSTSLLGLSNAVLNDWLAAELRVKPVSHSLHKHWKGLPNDGIIVFNCLCLSTFYVFIYLYLYVCLIMLLLNISVTN